MIILERKHDAWLARWSGADAWFVKPVDPFELADRVLALAGEPVGASEVTVPSSPDGAKERA